MEVYVIKTVAESTQAPSSKKQLILKIQKTEEMLTS